jgi:hypothetical protein
MPADKGCCQVNRRHLQKLAMEKDLPSFTNVRNVVPIGFSLCARHLSLMELKRKDYFYIFLQATLAE